jgi:hypothetical protein
LVAEGEIELKSALSLDPYPGGPNPGSKILTFSIMPTGNPCSVFGVKLPNTDSELSGVIYSRFAGVQWSGDGNELNKGSVIAYRVQFPGDSNTVVADDSGGGAPSAPDLKS